MSDIYISAEESRRRLEAHYARLARESSPWGPGGLTDASMRRGRARRAGIASGVARRARSTKRRPNPCTPQQARYHRQQALGLEVLRYISPEEFEQRFRALRAEQGVRFNQAGLDTARCLWGRLWRGYQRDGQERETTNRRMARALELAGRPRSSRTVQRARQDLVAMGLIGFRWIHRSGAARVRDNLDSLAVRVLSPPRINVHLLCGTASRGLQPLARSPFKQQTDLIPPPSAADEDAAPPGGERQATEREVLQAQIRFQHAKLAAGFRREWCDAELDYLRQRLELLGGDP